MVVYGMIVMKSAAITVLMMTLVSPALAQSAGDWRLGIGVQNIKFVENSGFLGNWQAKVADTTKAIFTGEYFIRDNIGVEFQATMPIKHIATDKDVQLLRATHFPISAMVLYRMKTTDRLTPFAGAGVAFSRFSDETAVDGSDVDIEIRDSLGLALAVGADFAISERHAIRTDIRWSDASAKVMADGTDVGKIRLNPTTVGVSYLVRF